MSQVLQAPLDFPELVEQRDLKETKVTLPVSLVYLVRRENLVALGFKDIWEPLESKAHLEFKG